jgi:hypothetical protein
MIETQYGEAALEGLYADQYRRLIEARAQLAFWRSEAAAAQQHLEAALGTATVGTLGGTAVITYAFETDEFGNTHRRFKVVEA